MERLLIMQRVIGAHLVGCVHLVGLESAVCEIAVDGLAASPGELLLVHFQCVMQRLDMYRISLNKPVLFYAPE